MAADSTVKIDPGGMMIVPKEIREKISGDIFDIRVDHGEIILKPVQTLDSLFGTLPDLNMKQIFKEHDIEVSLACF